MLSVLKYDSCVESDTAPEIVSKINNPLNDEISNLENDFDSSMANGNTGQGGFLKKDRVHLKEVINISLE